MKRPMTPPQTGRSIAEATVQLTHERDLYAAELARMAMRYEQKIQELSVLRRMSDLLRDCTEADEVCRRLLTIVQEELATACSLYLADDSGELALRARSRADGPVEILAPGDPQAARVPPGCGPLGETFTTGRVLVVPALPPETLGWFPPGAAALLTAPLGPATGCIGVLALHERDEESIAEDTTRLLPIVASQATIAIENAVLYRRIKRHSEGLEVRVRERTAALEHLNAELQAAARQRAQFVSHLSHELRTPLNSILGYSEMLQTQMGGPLNEKQQRYVGTVKESGGRLLRMINDIMDLAKEQAGKLSLQLQPMPLLPAIEQALTVLQPQANGKHLRLEHALPEGLGRVVADPTRVQQVLLNLLSNAVKFTPEGGKVTVSARQLGAEDLLAEKERVPSRRVRAPRREAAPLSFMEISVTDTGVGIAAEDQARLFQDFEQVGGGRYQGTGLGLSLTRRLVELHGGQVGVRSGLGRGSSFWFTLPTADASSAP
jgi:signal transduction histidine kinase